jgi:hypothetical protein
LTGLLPTSRRYVRTQQQVAHRTTVPNAIDHLRAALDLREEIVREGSLKKLTQLGFVVYKAVLRLGSSAVIWFDGVLNI